MKASTSSPHSNWPPVRDQTAQAANYSNYDSLLAGINSIKREAEQSSLTFITITIDAHTHPHTHIYTHIVFSLGLCAHIFFIVVIQIIIIKINANNLQIPNFTAF